ncbi:MAG: tRNA (adenosine(37)-N6)-threonylcarbamoyltransferase complex transferase subunit TsaD [Pseudomonadota bacterium]|nr:tRNA (adenosine(37)-N6)-threonylcarbamoyltransferase complex transferase subunit TsaD [Pseudomonadota bacterium]
MSSFTRLLAIESSCDETSAAVFLPQSQSLFQEIYSQVDLHKAYGGVVPELASRSHLEKMYGVVDTVLDQASLSLSDVDAIAYTRGPGLVGPLLTGASYADALSLALGVPLIPIHHLEAHITIPLFEFPELTFPFLALLVSGGHTELILAQDLGKYTLLGSTLDDACGEAFDKCGKHMGLDYPAGPVLSKMADLHDPSEPFPILPEPLKGRKTLDFSFSGLKTAFSQSWASTQLNYGVEAFSYALQSTIVSSLVSSVRRAFELFPDYPLVVAGGVACNQSLRLRLRDLCSNMRRDVYFPSPQYCTDNAGMIVYNAYLRLEKFGLPRLQNQYDQKVQPRWPIETL